jgi:hypothetical protein
MRRNIDTLDESITDVRKAPGDEKAVDKRARLKLLRDLVELQNQTLAAVKTHLLGRDETGAPNEPIDVNEHNDQVEFERRFREMLSPWTQADLKLTCERCKVAGETVSHRTFQNYWTTGTNSIQYKEQELCRDCYEKTLQELYTQVKEARAQGEKKETS